MPDESDHENSSRRRARELEFEPPSSKRQRADNAVALIDPPSHHQHESEHNSERDRGANHEPNGIALPDHPDQPDVISDVNDTASLKIGSITYQAISKPYSVLPNEVKTAVFRWMRKYDQVTIGSSAQTAGRLSLELYQTLGFLDSSKEEQLREICIEKTRRLIYSKGRTFNGIQYTQDKESKRIWASWTEAWLNPDWDGDVKPPNRKKRLVSRSHIQGLNGSRDARRSEDLSDEETGGLQPHASPVDPEHLRIGRITWSDISKPGPYYFPHEVKVAMLRWMRKQENSSMGYKRYSLWSTLGFLDESKDERFREKCIEKAKTFIQNQTVYFKGKQYTQDEEGNRVWAPWTTTWLDDNWDGNTNPPPQSDISSPKQQRLSAMHGGVSPHGASQNVKTEPRSTPPLPGPNSASLGSLLPTKHTSEPNNTTDSRGCDITGGESSSMAGGVEHRPLPRSRHSLGSSAAQKRRASIRRSLQDTPGSNSKGTFSFSTRTQHSSSDLHHAVPALGRRSLGHIIDLSESPRHSTTRTPANSNPVSPSDEPAARGPQFPLPTPSRSQPPCRPYADCHQVIASNLVSLKWEECRALVRLLETSPWNPDIA
ncbi:hypothetical protein FGG08_007166 [Glutinoglossum americanum]|uniref:Uncharacterized protein n=1 Tax=Glutinoglossum americanum TaxID=1670608 RepID=A0A9P8KU84_9PEZI|nr:hypothetical protein FGG08_007166 [Glutinoglossum americanum]